jgi:hypothetical protein
MVKKFETAVATCRNCGAIDPIAYYYDGDPNHGLKEHCNRTDVHMHLKCRLCSYAWTLPDDEGELLAALDWTAKHTIPMMHAMEKVIERVPLDNVQRIARLAAELDSLLSRKKEDVPDLTLQVWLHPDGDGHIVGHHWRLSGKYGNLEYKDEPYFSPELDRETTVRALAHWISQTVGGYVEWTKLYDQEGEGDKEEA